MIGLAELAPDKQVEVVITTPEGSENRITTNHTFSANQIEWFKAGSALNLIRQRSGN